MLFKAGMKYLEHPHQEIEADTHEQAAWIYLRGAEMNGVDKGKKYPNCSISLEMLQVGDLFVVYHEVDNEDGYSMDSHIFSAMEMIAEMDKLKEDFYNDKIGMNK
ncbi:TPA: hypothetical protein EYN98_07085 [Candidatus Poribacteria bacterium]|nr:hypothetical protein [Candidatus Poribacteria bacterium]